jgi:hypothetical protein
LQSEDISIAVASQKVMLSKTTISVSLIFGLARLYYKNPLELY